MKVQSFVGHSCWWLAVWKSTINPYMRVAHSHGIQTKAHCLCQNAVLWYCICSTLMVSNIKQFCTRPCYLESKNDRSILYERWQRLWSPHQSLVVLFFVIYVWAHSVLLMLTKTTGLECMYEWYSTSINTGFETLTRLSMCFSKQ